MPINSLLQALADTLKRLEAGELSAASSVPLIRSQYQGVAEHLPPRFEEVLNEILDRMEAGALFTEESCSFSQSDLHQHLALWLDKVRQRLQAQP